MSRPRVLLDCDGVLADFIGGALKLINSQWGTSYRSADVTEFDFCRSLGMSDDEASSAKRLISSWSLSGMLDVLPGSEHSVACLSTVADVYIVTSPWRGNSTWTHDREGWLSRHFGIRADRVVHTSAKHLVVGDFLVDDNTETLRRWQAAHPTGIAVQWQTPHNRRDEWTGASTCSWDKLMEAVTHSYRSGLSNNGIDETPGEVERG